MVTYTSERGKVAPIHTLQERLLLLCLKANRDTVMASINMLTDKKIHTSAGNWLHFQYHKHNINRLITENN